MASTKILIVDTYYPDFRPTLHSGNYDTRLAELLGYHFGTGDSYSYHLKQLGYDVRDVIADHNELQTQWASEHQLKIRRWPAWPYLNRLHLYRILEAQLKQFQPDILYMQNMAWCDPLTLRKLKKRVKLLVGQIASPLPPKAFVKPFDLVLTSFPHFVPRLKALGLKAEYFKIGFEERVLAQLGDNPAPQYDVVFIGGFTKVHTSGAHWLETLARQVPVDVWGYGIDSLSAASPLRQRYHGQAWGMEMYRIIRQAKICINRHSAAAQDYANNMRLFETTGLGTLLITDHKSNLHELFEVGKEVISYLDADELVDKVKYYLAHDTERATIAKAGQTRTLHDHTYQQRMQELDQLLKRYL